MRKNLPKVRTPAADKAKMAGEDIACLRRLLDTQARLLSEVETVLSKVLREGERTSLGLDYIRAARSKISNHLYELRNPIAHSSIHPYDGDSPQHNPKETNQGVVCEDTVNVSARQRQIELLKSASDSKAEPRLPGKLRLNCHRRK